MKKPMKRPMKTGAVLSIVAGLALLAAGTVLQFSGGPPKADAPLAQACRDAMKRRAAAPNLVEQCSETAFATTVTATDAQSAARRIGAANQREVGANALAMALIGLGIALILGGAVAHRRIATPGG